MGPFFVKITKIFWARNESPENFQKIPKHGSIFGAKSLNMGTFFTSKHGLGSRGPGGTPPSKPKSSTPPPPRGIGPRYIHGKMEKGKRQRNVSHFRSLTFIWYIYGDYYYSLSEIIFNEWKKWVLGMLHVSGWKLDMDIILVLTARGVLDFFFFFFFFFDGSVRPKVWNPYPYLRIFLPQKTTDLTGFCFCFLFCFVFPNFSQIETLF